MSCNAGGHVAASLHITLTGEFCVIKAALDAVLRLTRWALDAVWPAPLAYRLIVLDIINQILDIDLQGGLLS
jgi:hypothetical protein